MKIAILLLVHRDMQMIEKLLDEVKHTDFDIYIHVDSKFLLSKEQICKLKKKAYVLDKRYDITLFGFNMIEATLDLIKKSRMVATNTKCPYSYYILLSGQDYPILKMDVIRETLEFSYPKSFIDVDEYMPNNWVYESFSKHYVFKNIESKYTFLNNNEYIRKLFIAIPRRMITNLLTILLGSPKANLDKMKKVPYGGSQWWILSDILVDEVLAESKNADFINVMKHVFSPDETYFQTIIMNSKNRHLVIEKNISYKAQNTMTFSDFRDEKGNPYGHPRILTDIDISTVYEHIIQNKYFFIRKLDYIKSKNLLDFIDKVKQQGKHVNE